MTPAASEPTAEQETDTAASTAVAGTQPAVTVTPAPGSPAAAAKASAPTAEAVPSAPARTTPVRPAARNGEVRNWLRRLRRTTQPTPPDPDRELGMYPPEPDATSLLYRSPFQIGFQVTLGGLCAFALLSLFVSLQGVVLLGMLALFFALGLNPIVEWVHRHGAPRWLAVAIVALTLLILIGLGAWAVLPLLTDQANQLVQNFPAYLQGLRENDQIARLDQEYNIINKVIEAVASGTWVEGMFGGILGAGVAIFNVVFSFLITLVLMLWFLASLPGIKNTIYQLAPASRRPRVKYLANEMFRRIGGYMSGVFTVVVLASTTAFIFLNIIGLSEFALALAVIVAACAFIPLVGPTISMLIVSLVAFSHSPTAGAASLIFFVCYQQLDAYILQPRIFQRSVNVPGPLVVLAALSGGILFGIVGALLAIPTVASLLLLYREVVVPALDRA